MVTRPLFSCQINGGCIKVALLTQNTSQRLQFLVLVPRLEINSPQRYYFVCRIYQLHAELFDPIVPMHSVFRRPQSMPHIDYFKRRQPASAEAQSKSSCASVMSLNRSEALPWRFDVSLFEQSGSVETPRGPRITLMGRAYGWYC